MTWFVRPLLGHTPLFEQELEILSLKPVSAVKCWITEAGSSELGLASTFKRLQGQEAEPWARATAAAGAPSGSWVTRASLHA